MDDEDVEIVVRQTIINKQCLVLELGRNKITSIGPSILADALLNNNTLERLNLYRNCTSDKGIQHLAKALRTNNHTLKELGISGNGIMDNGVEYIVKFFILNRTLTQLWLNANDITDRGVRLLAQVLQSDNNTLKEPYLSFNKSITSSSADALSDIIKH